MQMSKHVVSGLQRMRRERSFMSRMRLEQSRRGRFEQSRGVYREGEALLEQRDRLRKDVELPDDLLECAR